MLASGVLLLQSLIAPLPGSMVTEPAPHEFTVNGSCWLFLPIGTSLRSIMLVMVTQLLGGATQFGGVPVVPGGHTEGGGGGGGVWLQLACCQVFACCCAVSLLPVNV